MAGFFFTGEEVQTPEAIDRKRALIAALAKENLSTAPVGHWTQALARVVGAGADQYETARLNQQEKKSVEENKRALMAAFGLGGAASPGAPTAAAGAPASVPAAAPTGKPPIFAQLNGVNPSLIQSESGGNWQAQNNAMGAGGKPGHFGRLQFGQARLQDAMNAGVIPQGTTPQQFMASPELQMAAERWHFGDIDKAIANGPAAAMIGKAINGVPVTQEGLRAVAHLGGVGGMNKFVQSGGVYNPADANGTTLMAYLQRHAGQGIARPSNNGPSMQPPANAALVAALGNGQPVNVPPGAPPGTPQIVANNAAPGAQPVQAQFNVPGVGLVPAQGASTASPSSGMNPQAAALMAALSSPWAARNPVLAQLASKSLEAQIGKNPIQEQLMRVQLAAEIRKLNEPDAAHGVIGENADGSKTYGWINKRNQTVTPTNATGDGGPPKIDNVMSVRKEITALPEVKSYTTALPAYNTMVRAAQNPSAAGDLAFVYGLAKVFDPDSVVREGEMQFSQNAQSIPDRVLGTIRAVVSGQTRLDEKTKQELIGIVGERMNEMRTQYDLRLEGFRPFLQQYKIDEKLVLPKVGDVLPVPKISKVGGGVPTAPAAPATGQPATPPAAPPTREQIIEEMRRRGLNPPQ